MEADAGFAEKRVGSRLKGKYSLERLIGVGGMASVYRGTHRNGHRVAVKVLHPALAANAELRDRFLREGYLANRVDHHGAVRVLDDDVADDGSVFLVMELLEGESLAARWERNGHRLAQREVAALARQLLDVLAAAHSRGVVHRDIKPENLFVTTDGALKVLDFGIARLREPAGTAVVSATRTGGVLGTPAYMPPEQVLGRSREIDGQTDLWAVGATMFALLSGQYVHDSETVEELIVYAGSRRARPLGSVAPDVAPSIAAVVDRALAFDKAARWLTSRAMQGALEEACALAFATVDADACAVQLAATIPAPTLFEENAPATTATPTGIQPAFDAAPLPSPDTDTCLPTRVAPPQTASTTAGVVETPPRSMTPRRVVWSGLSALLIAALAGGTNLVIVANHGGGTSATSNEALRAAVSPSVPSLEPAPSSAAPGVGSAGPDPAGSDDSAPVSVGEPARATTARPRSWPSRHGATVRQQPPQREPPSRSRW
jgi:serine/threonine protein kinase